MTYTSSTQVKLEQITSKWYSRVEPRQVRTQMPIHAKIALLARARTTSLTLLANHTQMANMALADTTIATTFACLRSIKGVEMVCPQMDRSPAKTKRV